MQPGDLVICRASRGYAFTEGKQYTVLKYDPPCYEKEAGFTWPAYVMVTDDYDRNVYCHAHRFIPE